MRALVNDDEVELQADADACEIPLQVPVLEAVAVRDGALVLHTCVWHFDQLVTVFGEGVLAKVAPKNLEHGLRLGELWFRAGKVLGNDVEIERQVAEAIAEMFIRADVEGDAV